MSASAIIAGIGILWAGYSIGRIHQMYKDEKARAAERMRIAREIRETFESYNKEL